ncbi:uncharacterized protein BKCO1_2500083 [Diplodia corticola]|uniref:Uncharacterized protein n=1 Tax=Diplodia corticola TaxID=236234 RepID=A0A1J9QYP3_9PEZI|nr:uncharacterized protein BKCO1_2500083 [Diplodia corticola]OJD34182.1 hypothetical protein BKCO1_2500083 [Diplodia corticola]
MTSFNKSKWYQISSPNGVLSFVGTPTSTIDNKTSVQPYGPVFLRISNTSDHEQQWQVYNINTSHAVLRTRASGPDNYLSAAIAQNDEGDVVAGNTKPIMGNYSLLDDSMYWSVGAWSDRLFWFENAQNGSAWHLNATGAFFLMSMNITAPQDGQQFKFTPIGDIDDDRYSTYSAPGAVATATATATGSSPTSTTTSLSLPSSNGRSAGAKGAIGAAVGGVSLLGLGLALLLCLRRRRKRPAKDAAVEPYRTEPVQEPQVLELPAETAAGAVTKHQDQRYSELPPGSSPSELGNHEIAELDGGGSWK